jgi:hypothetical protein
MHQHEAGKQAYSPPDVEEILSLKALICHSAIGERYRFITVIRYENMLIKSSFLPRQLFTTTLCYSTNSEYIVGNEWYDYRC